MCRISCRRKARAQAVVMRKRSRLPLAPRDGAGARARDTFRALLAAFVWVKFRSVPVLWCTRVVRRKKNEPIEKHALGRNRHCALEQCVLNQDLMVSEICAQLDIMYVMRQGGGLVLASLGRASTLCVCFIFIFAILAFFQWRHGGPLTMRAQCDPHRHMQVCLI